jgi:serine/threonine protein kinase
MGAGVMPSGAPFLALELVARGSLKEFLIASCPDKRLSWSQKLSVALDVSRGMTYIHEKGHMHRDLKSGMLQFFMTQQLVLV